MMIINLPIKSDVPVVAPGDSCCNCDSTASVTSQLTDLRRMPLWGLAGAEIKVKLPFPYCELCAATANRRRPTALGVIAVSLLLALVLGMCWLFAGPQLSEELTEYIVAPFLLIFCFAAVIGFYALKKPSGEQTSYYQPIKLKNTGHKWPADITGLELAFTNARYADKFSMVNLATIAAKKIKVSKA
ncbi:hypothetical protein HSX11_27745 [Oxalobacteraceae bacterium]|nr:hypothetical protein [Oxalobacteraceae bacterium]